MSLATVRPSEVATPNNSDKYSISFSLVVLTATLLCGAAVGFAGYLALSSIIVVLS